MREIAPGQTLDQYEILDVIARSGMATIFKARDTVSGRTVVLKVPHLQFEADVVFYKRFQREEEIGLRLDHPSIVKVLRPVAKSRMYLVQEYVEGDSLRQFLKRHGALAIETAVKITVQIADALEYLHEAGVVHRDLKPENIILTPERGIKIMDFGIAFDAALRKMTWSGLSQTTGTPDYMAPEQVEGQRGDPRTDLYSLGVMLYEMLTGQVPFGNENAMAAMRDKVVRDPEPPRRLRPDIPPGLEKMVLLALARDPQRRPESAYEFREMVLHPDSVVDADRAPREPDGLRLSPRARRALAVAIVVVGSSLIIGVLGIVSQFVPKGSGSSPQGPEPAWNRPPH
jgi:serine/threonine-protein kinase